jgi:tRNA(Arg) A34 adenosine deaminase TadA
LAGSTLIGPAPASADPASVDPVELELLRRTFELAVRAREAGGAPYGALVADAEGNIVAEQGNTSSLVGGDPTQHAEMLALPAGWRVLDYEGMSRGTLYASTEPCSMCAGAAYWSGIGRVVYGLSNLRLFEFTGDNPQRASFALPCRDILLYGQREVTVVGPLLQDEAAKAHEGYWR